MDKELKTRIINEYARHEGDVGSPEVQSALLTHRIKEVSAHLKAHPKDNHSKRGLQMMVSKRRKHLDYLSKKDNKRYRQLIQRLELRR